jgi:cytochrome c oxidase assembly factor CtaG
VRPDPYTWSPHLEATLPILLLALGYALATRPYHVSRLRAASFAAGIALVLATAVTPIDSLSYHLLTVHLLQNVILAEWAPALLVLGLPPALARRARIPLLAALPVWVGTYFVWHLPPLYDTALEHSLLLHAEHVSYLAAGIVFWLPLLHGGAHDLAKAVYVFAAFVLSSPLGLLLALLPEPIYDWYADVSLWGLAPLEDQQLAGLTMAGEESLVFFAVFSYYVARFMSAADADEGAAGDHERGGGGDARADELAAAQEERG